MSAATSGWDLPLQIILPTLIEDVKNIKVGVQLIQRNRIFGSPQEIYNKWFIKSIKNGKITVSPLRGPYRGYINDDKTITENILKEKFYIMRTL